MKILNKIRKVFAEKQSRVGGMVAYSEVGRPVWTPRQYDKLSEEGYQKNVIVYRCVNLISRGVASVPWRVFKKDRELFDHPLFELLHSPNPNQGGAAFIEAVIAFKLLSGNSYIELVKDHSGNPQEMYTLRPDRIKIIPGPGGLPRAYEYSVGGQSKNIYVDPITGESDILHLKTFNPLNDWYGMSPVEAAACAIDQHNAVSSHNLALLQNGGRPSGALKIKTDTGSPGINEDQRRLLHSNIQDTYEGALNAGKIMILEGNLEWQEMGLSPKDLDFVAGKQVSAREIAQAYGVPPMLVGVPGDATFANYREARYHMWEDIIVPMIDHLCDEFNQWLAPRFGSDIRLGFDIDSIPALAEHREKTWQRINESNFLTINEKRQFMGYHPISDGDKLQEPANE